MYRRIALLHMTDGPDPSFERAVGRAASGLVYSHLAAHLPGTVGGGHYTWDLGFDSCTDCPPWDAFVDGLGLDGIFAQSVERADVVSFTSANVHIAEPLITKCIKRTLFIQVERTTPDDRWAEFNRVLTGMPRYIATIRNWAYHRVDDDATAGPIRWTNVWEQEYASLDGLQGEYMMNPYHWGYVDPWFDPESPTRIVDTTLAHVFCPAAASVLTATA